MYQVLARQWRPKNFHELVGQTHVAQALSYALDHDRIHHAYLFTGTRGVGKTTIARIFAKSLNCLTHGVSSHPCGECEHCQEIDAGRFPDLIEVDAASRTGVDDTRELLDNVPYTPVKGRYKVYLIDEVHMFSKSSFNALLKTLEEPPPHVKFILATTDPQKLPATVLSRCLQFHLKNLTPRQISGHLAAILNSENTPFDDEALTLIARAGNGSMRDSLSLLDQAIAFGQGEVRTRPVAGLLGAVPTRHFLAMIEAMARQDCAGLRRILADMDEYAPDYGVLLAELMQQFQRITVLQLAAQQPDEYFEPELALLAGSLPVELMQLWYQIATDTWQYFPYQPNARLAFEMMLLRMAAMQPLFPGDAAKTIPDLAGTASDATLATVAHLSQMHHDAEAAKTPAPAPSPDAPAEKHEAPVASAQNEQPAAPAMPPMEALPLPESVDAYAPFANDDVPPWDDVPPHIEAAAEEHLAPAIAPPPAQEAPAAPSADDEAEAEPPPADLPPLAETLGDVEAWSRYVRHLPKAGKVRMFADNACPVDWQPPLLTLQVPFMMTGFDDGKRLVALGEALAALVGEPCEIALVVNDDVMTPGKWRNQAKEAEQARAEQAFYQHALTLTLQERLDAKVQPHSIQSLTTKTE
ncbi:MAG: DNA polymerase III subunit gamma/tau [Cardiobacteriaceae bacterium]|nr:DNA polymerase III subunit gamma/tau [Cardiobacteriaceae bacterium]